MANECLQNLIRIFELDVHVSVHCGIIVNYDQQDATL